MAPREHPVAERAHPVAQSEQPLPQRGHPVAPMSTSTLDGPSDHAATAVVAVDGLTMRFGDHAALSDLHLRVLPGVTGLVGANGAGKTTLFNLWLGLLSPTTGRITVGGLDPVRDGAVVRSRVGFSPERNVLPDDMAADEFVRHLAEVKGLPRSEARGRASDALWLVGLGEERFRPLGTMSTGQRQRVKLAQALASDPDLILLDEPTDGLDPVQRDEMLRLIADVHREVGIDIIVSSHVLEEVERVCENVVILDAGRLVAAGPVAELVDDAGGTIDVELVDDDATVQAVAEALRGSGLEVSVQGQRLNVDGADTDAALDAVRDAVAVHDARLHTLGARRITLEDVFLARSANGAGTAPDGRAGGGW